MSVRKKTKALSFPEPTIKRLAQYLNYVKILEEDKLPFVSAPHIARVLKSDPTQVTKDIAYTGISGKPRVGYNVNELLDRLEKFLGFDTQTNAYLFGAGHLGIALLRYSGFLDYGIKIIAAFDSDPEVVGSKIGDVKVQNIKSFRDYSETYPASIGIITTPVEVAQSVTDLIVAWGIKAIWNFAPVIIKAPEHIIVQNTSMYENIALLLKKIQNIDSENIESN